MNSLQPHLRGGDGDAAALGRRRLHRGARRVGGQVLHLVLSVFTAAFVAWGAPGEAPHAWKGKFFTVV